MTPENDVLKFPTQESDQRMTVDKILEEPQKPKQILEPKQIEHAKKNEANAKKDRKLTSDQVRQLRLILEKWEKVARLQKLDRALGLEDADL